MIVGTQPAEAFAILGEDLIDLGWPPHLVGVVNAASATMIVVAEPLTVVDKTFVVGALPLTL